MISANGGLPAHRYTPQVTQRWPRGSEPASMFTIFYKIVGSTVSEVDPTRSKPKSGALHTYVDLGSKHVGAPAPRVGGSHRNFMYYIEKSLFFEVLSLKLRTFFSFILI